MNKITKTMVISLLLIIALPMAKLSAQVSVWDGTTEPWTHGTGTEADPFLIENAQQLAYLAYRVNNGLDAGGGHVSNHDYHYKLMVDVDLNGSESFQWTPIGYYISSTDYQCFGGCFDGNNHNIFELYINNTVVDAGLFGYSYMATIRNTNIINGFVSTNDNLNGSAGGIVGRAIASSIINCSTNTIVFASNYAGGIVGFALGETMIKNCCHDGDVTGLKETECGSGGIVGTAMGVISIENCYNTGRIVISSNSWTSGAGGLVGNIIRYEGFFDDILVSINNCYNVGSTQSGPLVGSNSAGYQALLITNSYYLNSSGGGNNYSGIPMSAEAMQSAEFVDLLNGETCAWEQDVEPYTNSGYPILTLISVSTATTNSSNITQTHTTFHGIINTENASILSQGFEYKKTSVSYYQTINVSGNGSISTTLSGLEPNTQYQYRTFCTPNDCGVTYYGEIKTFFTLPVNITTNSATNVTANSATLHGCIGIGDATLVSKGFEYRAEGETDFITVNTAGNDNDFNAQITGLQLNTTYEYRAFMNIAESPTTYYGITRTFEVTWLNLDTICIDNIEMLHWVSEQCNSGTTFEGKCIKLMNDITLPLNVPNNMISIGSYPDHPFKGTFDGNGKLITNLYIDQPNTPYQGFFGYTLNANLYNVGLVNITASGRNYTGGMVAYAENTYMRDCYVNGGTLFALSYCGGLVGYQEQGTNSIISGCYNTCSVSGNHYVGGLIGFSNYSTVRNSYVAAPVSGQGDAIGAIIGGANEVLMYYCYFSTEITGQTNAIGWNNIGKDGGEGLTNAQMRDPQFVNTLNQGLVTPVWMADYATHINNGFPIIKWQRPGTGVEEHNAAKSYIFLYPNPANGFVTIQSDDSNVSLKHMEVYDTMGRKVMSEILDGQCQGFSIEKLPAGVYHVRILFDNGCYTNLKLVVQ